MPRGVEVSAAARQRLCDAADVLGLDEAAIARSTKLSRRVVREVLAGKRTRISEDSLARLERTLLGTGARAIATSAAPVRRRVLIPAGIAAFVLAILVVAAWRLVHPPLEPELIFRCSERRIGVRDARTRRVVWDSTLTARTEVAFIAPWKDASMVIYGTQNDGDDGGKLFGRDIATGSLLWSFGIPPADAARHFPDDVASTGRFKPARTTSTDACGRVRFEDFDGDGVTDVALRWIFEPWYPACVAWYSVDPAQPRRLVEKGRYYTCGSIYSVTTHDVDGDGRPGVVVAGTNNASGYQGAMLAFLDAQHWSGGSVDSIAAATHWRSPPGLEDGSLARIVFPQFDPEFMTALGIKRLEVTSVTVARDTIEAVIGHHPAPAVVVRLNECLELIDVRPAPGVARAFAAAPEALGRFTDGYLDRWAGRAARFGACLR